MTKCQLHTNVQNFVEFQELCNLEYHKLFWKKSKFQPQEQLFSVIRSNIQWYKFIFQLKKTRSLLARMDSSNTVKILHYLSRFPNLLKIYGNHEKIHWVPVFKCPKRTWDLHYLQGISGRYASSNRTNC